MRIRFQISTLNFSILFPLLYVGLIVAVGGIAGCFLLPNQAKSKNLPPAFSSKPVSKTKPKKTLDLDLQPRLKSGNTPLHLLPIPPLASSPSKKSTLPRDQNAEPQPRLTLELPEVDPSHVKCLTDACRYKQMIENQPDLKIKPQDFLKQTPRLRLEMKY